MKFNGRGYILGSEPSTELWEIRSKAKYLPKATSKSANQRLNLTISKMSMPTRLPPIKFETRTKLKPKNKSIHPKVKPSVLNKPIVRSRHGSVVKPKETLEVIYESSEPRILESESPILKVNSIEKVESRLLERRNLISKMISEFPKLHDRTFRLKDDCTTIDDYNNDKFRPEELSDKNSSSCKFWRPSDVDKDTEVCDSLPKEYLEFSFYLCFGSKSRFVSLQGDAPLSNITSFIQQCITTTNHTDNMNAFSFTLSNDLVTNTDDLGPWNTKVLSDLGLLNSEIRVIPLEEF